MAKELAGTIPNYFKQHGKQVSWIKDVTAYGDGRKDIQSRNSYKNSLINRLSSKYIANNSISRSDLIQDKLAKNQEDLEAKETN